MLPEIASIHACLRSGDLDKACGLAREAYIAGVEDPLVLNLVAFRLEERGDLEGALSLLDEAVRLTGSDANLYASLGHCLVKLARPTHALEAFNRALKLDPRLARAHHGAGLALTSMGEIDAGEAAQRRAHALDANFPGPIAALALAALQKRDFQAAQTLSRKALALDAGETLALVVKGALLAEAGDDAASAAFLQGALARPNLPPMHRSSLERQYGDALDGLGRFPEAFGAYASANGALRRVFADRFDAPDLETILDVTQRLTDHFADYPDDGETKTTLAAEGGAASHVFLMGFPRSGTTLLEQVLAGHPDVVALEEKGTLHEPIDTFFFQEGGVEKLMNASEAALEEMRAAYWARVRGFAVNPEAKVFVDKQPSLTLYLPLVRRLFPTARVLFCLRDPRDVVLGCFRRSFRMNATVYQYTTLESLADLYAATMRAAEVYFSRLPLSVHRHRHEDLVADIDGEVARLCAFLDLKLDPAMIDFVQTARRRDVRTPSAKQVLRGLNASGVEHWRNYTLELQPVLQILEPWALSFGYTSGVEKALNS